MDVLDMEERNAPILIVPSPPAGLCKRGRGLAKSAVWETNKNVPCASRQWAKGTDT